MELERLRCRSPSFVKRITDSEAVLNASKRSLYRSRPDWSTIESQNGLSRPRYRSVRRRERLYP